MSAMEGDPYNWRPALLRGDCSHQAALSIAPHRSRLQAVVLDALRLYRAEGLVAQEIEAVTGLRQSTVSARIRELVLSGAVYDSGLRRRTKSGRSAAVWRVRM